MSSQAVGPGVLLKTPLWTWQFPAPMGLGFPSVPLGLAGCPQAPVSGHSLLAPVSNARVEGRVGVRALGPLGPSHLEDFFVCLRMSFFPQLLKSNSLDAESYMVGFFLLTVQIFHSPVFLHVRFLF